MDREEVLDGEALEAALAKEHGKAIWQRVKTPRGSVIIRREALKKKATKSVQVNFSKTGSLFRVSGSFGSFTSLPGQSFDDFMEIVKGYLYEYLTDQQ